MTAIFGRGLGPTALGLGVGAIAAEIASKCYAAWAMMASARQAAASFEGDTDFDRTVVESSLFCCGVWGIVSLLLALVTVGILIKSGERMKLATQIGLALWLVAYGLLFLSFV